jgi:hypothetical protein
MALRPRPRSSACRTPISALGGAPIPTSNETIREGRVSDPFRLGRVDAAVRMAGQMPRTKTATIAANPPSNRTGASKTNPVEGSANRTSPTTVRGETKNARTTPPGRSDDGDEERPGHAHQHELAPGNSQCAQRGVRLGFDGGLPGQRLDDHDDPHQRRETGQDPPSDGLGADRVFDPGRFVVDIGDREAPQRLRLSLELREAGRAVAKLDEVGVEDDRLRVQRPREGRGGVEVVAGAVAERKFDLGCFDPHHAQGDGRTGRPYVGALFNTALRWDGATKGTRITVPTCTPSSCARVNDANTWSGSD